MSFKGFKVVAAMIAVSEIGTFSRFEHPKKLMAYLGLVPTENSSGGSRKQGGISKCVSAQPDTFAACYRKRQRSGISGVYVRGYEDVAGQGGPEGPNPV